MPTSFRLFWLKNLFNSSLFSRQRPGRFRVPHTRKLLVDLLEDRISPTTSPITLIGAGTLAVTSHVNLNLEVFHNPARVPAGQNAGGMGVLPQDGGSPFPTGLAPSDIQAVYGINNIKFGSVIGDGTGQTIAIVDAYDEPAFVDSTDPDFSKSDLAKFDKEFGLPDPPNFTKVNQEGQTSPLPGTDPAGAGNPNGNWEMEEALDVEWAHAVAPKANILLVEANSANDSDLYAAVDTARKYSGVSVVSMSWGEDETSSDYSSYDSLFTTPSGHNGVTFVAASGDTGAYSDTGSDTQIVGYPASSANVVGVGGTTLQIDSNGNFSGETAWSGSGGGISLYEPEPAYQKGVQNTGFRTVPDVAFDADPQTGVSVYDSYDNTDLSGDWYQIGGTSLAAPSWAALIAIADQGRAVAGGSTLDGKTETLPALYSIPATDFNDITSGSNGVFSAGPGYDEVTGRGSPNAPALTADLAAYATSNHMVVTGQPPSSLIAGDSFGVIVAAEDPLGGIDPAYSGQVTIALGNNPSGATLGGTLTVTAQNGLAVFDGLTLNQLGSGYTLQITNSTFPSITTSAFAVIANPTPWQQTYYPVGTDASLRNAINQADENANAFNTIILSASPYLLSNTSLGALVIENSSSLPSKTLTITGEGSTNSVIESAYGWMDRIFQIEGSATQAVNVTLQNLTIQGGNAQNGGVLGGDDALGGGLLIDDATVTLVNDVIQDNQAQGGLGTTGAAGVAGGGAKADGGAGGSGKNGFGGGIYLASGTLSLFNDIFSGNEALGGHGGAGGAGGGQGTQSKPAYTPGQGGPGGRGGTGAGGALYVAGGTVLIQNDTFGSNQAVGGPGGTGGTGGSGGHGKGDVPGKQGGLGGAGGVGGPAFGGAIYLAGGSLTLTGTTLKKNSAIGGAGGQGGAGGPGTHVGSGLSILNGTGTGTTLGGLGGESIAGGPGGNAGPGGGGGGGSGGGVYVAGGSLTLVNVTLQGNQAVGGQGGQGGVGGTGGLGAGSGTGTLSLFLGQLGGQGGTGGDGGAGHGGGILVAGGHVVLCGVTSKANLAHGGKGGMGGTGGNGGLAAQGTGLSLGSGGSGTGGSGGTWGTGGGGLGANTGGAGGQGGKGGAGNGGALYVSGGALTLVNNTVATNTAEAGASGSGGSGGKGGTGNLTGGQGDDGTPGDSYGGGLYVNGGAVTIDNSTIALNIQEGTGFGGGAVVQSPGNVLAVSTLFAGNGTVDYSAPSPRLTRFSRPHRSMAHFPDREI